MRGRNGTIFFFFFGGFTQVAKRGVSGVTYTHILAPLPSGDLFSSLQVVKSIIVRLLAPS